MKYKVKFWNSSLKDYQIMEYPYLDTALMMAQKIAHKAHIPVFITDGSIEGIIVTEGRL